MLITTLFFAGAIIDYIGVIMDYIGVIIDGEYGFLIKRFDKIEPRLIKGCSKTCMTLSDII